MMAETSTFFTKEIVLGEKMGLEALVAVARHGARVVFSPAYCRRVEASRRWVDQWLDEDRVMYGVTTGFGALCDRPIGKQQAAQLQRNILLSHATSVGAPLAEEQVRATLFMMLQNLGQGYSGVRLQVLEQCAAFLNLGLSPWAPGEGSVGYLCPEAHMALALTGEGKIYWQGKLLPAAQALKAAGLASLELAAKEGLALISGTTSATALASLALWDMLNAAEAADVVGALSLEALKGVPQAFDERVMAVRHHPQQGQTAARLRAVLASSARVEKHKGERVQDALSLRCIPQLHGAAKKTLQDARTTLEREINSCCDNPIVWGGEGEAEAISACNADSSYVGLEMDSAAIAATMLAKMSERRNNRLLDGNLSALPPFLTDEPGLNSGLMIPQYTQAGLLGQMRVLCTPAVIDNTPLCAGQEDYAAMGYNAAKKAQQVAEKLEYVLTIELLSALRAQRYLPKDELCAAARRLAQLAGPLLPAGGEDFYLHPAIEGLREMIHSGAVLAAAEEEA